MDDLLIVVGVFDFYELRFRYVYEVLGKYDKK